MNDDIGKLTDWFTDHYTESWSNEFSLNTFSTDAFTIQLGLKVKT